MCSCRSSENHLWSQFPARWRGVPGEPGQAPINSDLLIPGAPGSSIGFVFSAVGESGCCHNTLLGKKLGSFWPLANWVCFAETSELIQLDFRIERIPLSDLRGFVTIMIIVPYLIFGCLEKGRPSIIGRTGLFLSIFWVFQGVAEGVSACVDGNKKNSEYLLLTDTPPPI